MEKSGTADFVGIEFAVWCRDEIVGGRICLGKSYWMGCIIVLLFQALLLAHGGLTTLGANEFSMTIVGPIVGYAVWKLCRAMKVRRSISLFLCAMFADWSTYVTTAFQLAIVFPDPNGGVGAALVKFLGIYAVTQIPLAIAEGLLTVIVYNLVISNDLWKESALQ